MKKKIVVAEDDPSLQEIFQLLLGRKGYEVEVIFNGAEVSDYGSLHADLFLLDLHLSGYSGLDICKQIKAHENTRHIPVIMISANPDIHILASSSGADEAIEKPFESKHLLQVISFYINKTGVS